MRGSPFLRVLLAAAFFAALGVVVAKVTSGSERRKGEAAERATPASSRRLEIRGESPAPLSSFRVFSGRAALLDLETPGATFAANVETEPGRDLVFEAEWADGAEAPAALRLRVWLEGGSHSEKVYWGRGRIRDVLSTPDQPRAR